MHRRAAAIVPWLGLAAVAQLCLARGGPASDSLRAPVVVLTSQQAADRHEKMVARLNAVGANFSFFPGLDGNQRIPPAEVRLWACWCCTMQQ